MDHRLPRAGALISVMLALGALITFVYLNRKFEGPDPTRALGERYELTARFADTRTLPTKQPVMHRGIPVGTVSDVEWDAGAQLSVVSFTIDGDFPLYRDARLAIGEKSLLGDAYLNVVSRGSEAAGRLEPGDEVAQTVGSVDFDEALGFLDENGRASVRSLIESVAAGVAPRGNGERLNATVAGTARTARELRALTRQLRGQERQLARLVSSASTVVSRLGQRESALREITSSGRITLDALASNTASLDRALAELPGVLDVGRRALAAVDPLLEEGRPLVAELRAVAPELRRALAPRSVQQRITRDLLATVDGLRPLRRVAEPVLRNVLALNRDLTPLVKVIGPAARNLVPALDYLTPRVRAIAGFYALSGAATSHADERGNYLRAAFLLDPAEQADTPLPANCYPATQDVPPNAGYCDNAYPKPDDALNPQPFEPPYPRLYPFDPPPRRSQLP